ncbi:MAG: ATP-binding protein [Bacteroidota bacterium]
MLRLLYTLLLCSITTIGFTQTNSIEFQNIQFSHLDKNSGLPNDLVWKVHQDSQGFLWFATHNGLTRWDGLNFQYFLPNPADSTTIMGTMIMDITEDKDGYLWFLVHNKGLARFDPSSEAFSNFRHRPHLKGLMRMKNFEDGYLWLGAYGSGMFRYEIATDSLTLLPLRANFEDAEDLFRLNSIVDIVQDVADNNILWCAGNDGLYRLNKTTLDFQYFQSPAKGTALMTINGLFMDEPSTLWMGAWGGGLIALDIQTSKWQYHTYSKPNLFNYDGNGYSDIVKSIKRKSPTELWVQTRDNGAGIFDIPSSKFRFFKPENNNPIAIKAGTGNRLFKDRDGRTWFTFEDTGVSYINPECQAFFDIPLDLQSCGTKFSENNVTDFGFDKQSNTIYAAANGCTGLFAVNPDDWSATPIPTLGMEGVYQIFMTVVVTESGEVWVGGESNKGGNTKEVQRPSLLYLDRSIGKLVPFENEAVAALDLQNRNVSDIIEGKNGVIWAATSDGDLLKINRQTDEVKSFSLNQKADTPRLQIRQIIYEDELIWVASSRGVFKFDVSINKFALVQSTSDLEVNTFALGEEGTLWLGTMQNGLKKLALSTELTSTPDASNLPYTLIDKIVIGKDNQLWLSTQGGVYFLDKSVGPHSDGHFQVYTKQDGLVFNNFYLHGFSALPDGTLLLGQNDQFYHVLPQCLTNPKTVQPVYLTSFQVLGATEPTPIQRLEHVQLNHDENFFTIHFSSLTFCQADKVRFTYKMEGLDKDWITTKPSETYQNYTKLAAGDYTFRIHRTGFAEDEQTLKITIHPPIWLSAGAYLLYGLLGFGLLFGVYRFQLNRQLLEREAQQLKEIDSVKNKAYANITHEFRTPLTVVLGLIEQAQKMEINDSLRAKLAGIKNNSNRILSLVNQILDLRKLDAGKFQLNTVQREITGFLKYIGRNLEPLATNKGIELAQRIEFDSLVMDYDPDNLTSVVTNLLDNAIKFTPEGGRVIYSANQQANQLIIEVSDSGQGIAPEDLPKIFDRYIGTESADHTSTGIGLALTKALVELMDGEIQVESTLGKGSIFRVLLPITQDAVRSDSPLPKYSAPTFLATHPKFDTPVDANSDKPIVLIVEDNLEIVNLIAEMFSSEYQVTYALDGQAGIDSALNLIPDLIISDVMMPRKNGFELCATLKENPQTSHIPIILLTAKTDDDHKIAGLKRGADIYLNKPIHQAELLLSVKNALNSRIALRHFFSLSTDKSVKKQVDKSEVSGIDFTIEDVLFQKVLAELAANYSNPNYHRKALSKAVDMSSSNLNRKLKVWTGYTIGNTIKVFRLEKAKGLLQTTNLNISEITFQVGFSDPSHFARAFKEYVGVTPTEFRENRVGI